MGSSSSGDDRTSSNAATHGVEVLRVTGRTTFAIENNTAQPDQSEVCHSEPKSGKSDGRTAVSVVSRSTCPSDGQHEAQQMLLRLCVVLAFSLKRQGCNGRLCRMAACAQKLPLAMSRPDLLPGRAKTCSQKPAWVKASKLGYLRIPASVDNLRVPAAVDAMSGKL